MVRLPVTITSSNVPVSPGRVRPGPAVLTRRFCGRSITVTFWPALMGAPLDSACPVTP
ncbi:hypothetical protein D3C85_1631770 [compost metagenome]